MYSVALCTYNGEKFIKEQLQSILTQTILPEQIVICDDSSTDSTIKKIRSIAECHYRIDWKIVINNTKLGYVKNFEKAISRCSHNYIFLADQDDVWLPDKAEKCISVFRNKPNISALFTNALIVDENLNSLESDMFSRRNFNDKTKVSFQSNKGLIYMLTKHVATGATMCFRRSFVHSALPIEKNKYVIHDGFLGILARMAGILGYIDEPLIYYRQHREQQIGAGLSQDLLLEHYTDAHNKGFLNRLIRRFYSTEDLKEQLKIIQAQYEKEEYFIKVINERTISISPSAKDLIEKRIRLMKKILSYEPGRLKRILKISPSYLKYDIPEFRSWKSWLITSFNYIISPNCSQNELPDP